MANPPLDARPDPQQVRALKRFQPTIRHDGDEPMYEYPTGEYVLLSDVEALLASSAPEPTIPALVEQLAARHHKEVEGEYGCGWPQTKCPGVLRLIDRLNVALEGAPLPSEGVTARAKFHAHLDSCSQCERNPFELCSEGARLLSETHRSSEGLTAPSTDARHNSGPEAKTP